MRKIHSTEAMRLLATSAFKPFNYGDWLIFPGCNAEQPLICWGEDDAEFTLMVDLDADKLHWQLIVMGTSDEDQAANAQQVFKLAEFA